MFVEFFRRVEYHSSTRKSSGSYQYLIRHISLLIQPANEIYEHILCGRRTAELHALSELLEKQSRRAPDASLLLCPSQGKKWPWKLQWLCCFLQPTAALKAVQTVFPLLTILHWESIFTLKDYFPWSIHSLWEIFMFFSHCVCLFLALFQGKLKWLVINFFFFFNSVLMLLWQNKFWAVGMIQCNQLPCQIVFPFYQEVLLDLDPVVCLCKEEDKAPWFVNRPGEICTCWKY